MRQINHMLSKSNSGKSIALRMEINDRYGKQKIVLATLKGWRMHLAEKSLLIESKEWTHDVARNFVAMKVLQCAKDEFEGSRFLNIVREHSSFEIHFWASKLMAHGKAIQAWKIMHC